MRLITLIAIVAIASMPVIAIAEESPSIAAQNAARDIQDSLRRLTEMQDNPNSVQAKEFLDRTQGALIRSTQNIDLSAEMDAVKERAKQVEKNFSILNKRDP